MTGRGEGDIFEIFLAKRGTAVPWSKPPKRLPSDLKPISRTQAFCFGKPPIG